MQADTAALHKYPPSFVRSSEWAHFFPFGSNSYTRQKYLGLKPESPETPKHKVEWISGTGHGWNIRKLDFSTFQWWAVDSRAQSGETHSLVVTTSTRCWYQYVYTGGCVCNDKTRTFSGLKVTAINHSWQEAGDWGTGSKPLPTRN